MKKGDFLFVYGTLRPGERADLSSGKSQWGVRHIGETTITGQIYDAAGGSYPGVKLTGEGTVRGDLFLIREDSVREVLDAYEGYPYLYDREVVQTADGRDAWVYTYNGDLPESCLIPSGDWKDR